MRLVMTIAEVEQCVATIIEHCSATAGSISYVKCTQVSRHGMVLDLKGENQEKPRVEKDEDFT